MFLNPTFYHYLSNFKFLNVSSTFQPRLVFNMCYPFVKQHNASSVNIFHSLFFSVNEYRGLNIGNSNLQAHCRKSRGLSHFFC